MLNGLDWWLLIGDVCDPCLAMNLQRCVAAAVGAGLGPVIPQPRKLSFFVLFATMVGSIISPQQMHFHASKDLTKS
jgi:hypothetical protein